jgi:signal transduction histidine kinase
VEADAGQIGQVLHNLAINAQQAMPEGGVIEISARNETPVADGRSSLPEGRHVSISVRDRGVGIPAKTWSGFSIPTSPPSRRAAVWVWPSLTRL